MPQSVFRIPVAVVLAFLVGPAVADSSATLPSVTSQALLDTTETVIGQPLTYPAGTADVTVAIITVPPGAETGWHIHAVPLVGYILEGTLTVDYGDKGTRIYPAGSALVEAMNWPHDRMNRGSVPVRILAVYAGAKGMPTAEAVAH
ncbi:MAG TPA: cupin domain-containing protein [Xanthobacteraceae bacterium]|nr:cupin domain-containing protein [Xanthobacteraceae bacterium]